jgi:hypothetical protein
VPASAGAIPYNGVLSLELGRPDVVVRIATSGTGTSQGLGEGLSLLAPGILGTTAVTLLTLPVYPIVSADAQGPAGIRSASFRPGAGPQGGLGGLAALTGTARLGLFGPPAAAFLTIPLGVVGAGGTATLSSPLGVRIRVSGTGWTTGTAKVFSVLQPTVTVASATGADLRSLSGLGSVNLVSPALMTTNIAVSLSVPIIARLEVTFVPEPGTLGLLGFGITGRILLRRRTAR